MVDPNKRVITLSENLQSLTANGGQTHSPDNGMVCVLPSPPSIHHIAVTLLFYVHVTSHVGSPQLTMLSALKHVLASWHH